jgi:hypothetical protein
MAKVIGRRVREGFAPCTLITEEKIIRIWSAIAKLT